MAGSREVPGWRQLLVAALVALLVAAVATPSVPAEPGASAAKKCKKHGKKKCKKKKKPKKRPGPKPQGPSNPPPGTPNPLYVTLGDSLMAGYGASSPSKDFVNLLLTHYTQTLGASQLARHGHPGATAAALAGAPLASTVADINAASDTRVVTVDAGGNEILSGACSFGAAPCTETFKSNFTTILSSIGSALDADPGDETLVALAYYNPKTGTGGPEEASFDTKLFGAAGLFDCEDTGAEVGLNDAIALVAEENGALLANAYPAFETGGQPFIYTDGIHPSDDGHAAIADAFESASAACPN